jgi:hypothetical protein
MAGAWESESDDLGLSSDGSDGEEEQARAKTGSRGDRAQLPRGESGQAQVPTEGDGGLLGGDEEELQEYAKSLGVDVSKAEESDLHWIAREAFSAPLPAGWTEHLDEEGRVYFFSQVTQESSWMHPMDLVYSEVINLVKAIRSDLDSSAGAQGALRSRQQAVQAHLEEVHQRALSQIEGWSGPYSSEAGQYFYHAGHDVSSWENPIEEWQRELGLRQRILHRCLLEQPRALVTPGEEADPLRAGCEGQLDAAGLSAAVDAVVELPRLPLALATPNLQSGEVPKSPSSTRSFATARSGRSARSARSPTPVRTKAKASGATAAASSPGRGAVSSSVAAAARVKGCSSPKQAAVDNEAKEVTVPPGRVVDTKDESPRPPSREEAGVPLSRPVDAKDGSLPSGRAAAQTTAEAKEASAPQSRPVDAKEETLPPSARAVAQAMAAAAAAAGAAGEDDEDSLEFTFGRTEALQLPQFGKVGAAAGR